jgi:hypothetical protein
MRRLRRRAYRFARAGLPDGTGRIIAVRMQPGSLAVGVSPRRVLRGIGLKLLGQFHDGDDRRNQASRPD